MAPERSRYRARPSDKRLLTLPETMALTGFSRTRTYEAAREGTLPGLVRLSGHRMLVRRRVLEAWLDGRDPPEMGVADTGGSTGDSTAGSAPVPLLPAPPTRWDARPRLPGRG